MSEEPKKTIAGINAEVQSGRSVVASVVPERPAKPFEKKADAVTSATLKNNIYLPPMPVMMPPPLPKKEKDSD